MNCINLFPPKAVERKVKRYVSLRMNLYDALVFEEHIMDCPYCGSKTMASMRINLINEKCLYLAINKAFDKGQWGWIIEMAEEMIALGYDESYHPIARIVNIACARLA